VSRLRTEIIGQILEIAKNFTIEHYLSNLKAISKLKMMYKGFLPCCLLACRKYERYRMTGKGLRSLRLYGELRQMISSKKIEEFKRWILSMWLSFA
jgi:hypothetical protein